MNTWYAFAIYASLIGLCAKPAPAQNSDPAAPPPLTQGFDNPGVTTSSSDLPLYLQVYLNGKDLGVVAAFIMHLGNNRMSSTRKELAEIGIRSPSGPSNGQLDLDALLGVTYRYDQSKQLIELQVDPVSLLPRVISAAITEEELTPSRDTGIVMNYSLATQFGGNGRFNLNAFSSTFDGWIFSPYGTLSSSGFFTYQAGAEPKLVRQNTTFVAADRSRALTFTLGDFITSSVDWSRPIRIGGFQIQRDFSMRSDIVTNQLLSFSGSAAVPSTVDVFIQNNRTFTTAVPAGPFQLTDLPVYTGNGEAEIVIRDQEGRVVRKSVSFFAAQNLLKPGRTDYSLNIGYPREAYGLESNQYGRVPVASGSLRAGVTDWMTVELHGEGMSGLAELGAGITVVPFSLAEISLSTGASNYQSKRASFVRGALRTRIGGIDVNMTSFRTEPGFADLAYATGVDYLGTGGLINDAALLQIPAVLDVISLSTLVHRDQRLGVSYVNSWRAGSVDRLLEVSYGFSLADGLGAFSLTGSRNFVSQENRISMEFSMLLGNRSQAHSSVSTDGLGHGTTGVYLSRPISEQVGDYGYGLQLEQSRNGTGILSGRSQYRSRFGEAGIEAYGGASQPSLLGTFDGAIVMGGGHFALGNTIQDSFALVDVGIPNVPVYLQNREVTRTGPGGEALVPGLSSYRSNRVSIRLEDLPDSPASGVTAMDVVPARKAGSFVNLNENISLGGTVVLKTVSGALLAPGTEVHFNDSQSASYVGYDGLTYFMGVKATNTVSARRGQVECSGQFARPPAPGDADPLIVVCQ